MRSSATPRSGWSFTSASTSSTFCSVCSIVVPGTISMVIVLKSLSVSGKNCCGITMNITPVSSSAAKPMPIIHRRWSRRRAMVQWRKPGRMPRARTEAR
jgi:hypothetical protein